MGRRATPTTELKLTGRYRADRHGSRADTLPLRTDLACPFAEDGEARTLWHKIVDELTTKGIAVTIDEHALRALCEVWSLYRAAYAAAEQDPVDKDCRLAVSTHFQNFWRAAGSFGLTPTSRASIKVTNKPVAKASEFARKRG